ncbi:MAG: tyrosine-type recombinase/integrase [Myxococcales bacterium]|nr:tyrosine-type recombinase/integrase [Myxococcales bacterium]
MSDRLTLASLRRLAPRARVYEVTCARLPGFVVRVLPSGKKVFLVRVTVAGRCRRVRIGQWGPALSLSAARARAIELLTAARETPGLPAALARDRDAPARADASRPTVRALARRFEREYVDVYLRPGTAAGYKACLKKHVIPALGDRPFDQVSRRDVQALHASLSDRRGVADTVVAVVGSLYSRIIDDWELSDMRNPAARVRRFGSRRVERFLTPEERARLVAVLERGLRIPSGARGHLEPFSVWAIRLLMLTGLRRDEVLSLTWPMVNWQHSTLHLPETKTGQRSVVVSREVMALLREIHERSWRATNPLVLRGRNGGKLQGLNRTWERVREDAGLTDVRLHDLRHSFASDALMSGVPLAIVGELLGHRQAATTKRYAHLSSVVVREALERATLRIVHGSSSPAGARAQPRAPYVPLTDVEWRAIEPLVAASRRPGGRPVDLRAAVDGARWVLERGAKWRELPSEYGAPTTTWRWYKRWKESGLWDQLIARLRDRID